MRELSGGVEYSFEDSELDEPHNAPVGNVPTVSATKAELLEDVEEGGSTLVIGSDISTKTPKGFSLDENPRAFVGVRDSRDAVIGIVNRYAIDGDKTVCLISSGDTDGFDGVGLVEDLDAFIEEYVASDASERQDVLLAIDGFCDFYDRISDEALASFEGLLKQSDSGVNVVTFDTMERIRDYRDTGLYVHLVRCECGAIVGGRIDDAVASSVCTEIYEIPHSFREKELKETQATVYRGKELAYVSVERG